MSNRAISLILSGFLCICMVGCSTEVDKSNDSKETSSVEVEENIEKLDDNVSMEYKQALKSAESYLKSSSFSKQGLYDQLTSEYADKFTAEAAQYAIDNIEADWNEEALEAGQSYLKSSSFSKDGLYDQLISEYADKFTAEQAQYAIDNIGTVDWNEEALEAGQSYLKSSSFSKDGLYDQLTSEYADKFTAEQAQYAVDKLFE